MSAEQFLGQQLSGLDESIYKCVGVAVIGGFGIACDYDEETKRVTVSTNGKIGNTGRFGIVEEAFPRPENGGYVDNVMRLGYNAGSDIAGEPSMFVSIEDKYALNNGTAFGSEWHVEGRREDQSSYRAISVFVSHDLSDGVGDLISLKASKVVLENLAGQVMVNANLDGGVVSWEGVQVHRWNLNNHPYHKQMNVAGTGTINLPFVDSHDRIHFPAEVYFASAINGVLYPKENIEAINPSGFQIKSAAELKLIAKTGKGVALGNENIAGGSLKCDGFNQWKVKQESTGRVPVTIEIKDSSTAPALRVVKENGTVVFEFRPDGTIYAPGGVVSA